MHAVWGSTIFLRTVWTKVQTAQQHCEHHARQLMVVEFFLWLKTTALQQLTKPGPLLRRQEYLCQGLQTKDVLLKYRKFRTRCKALGGTQGYTLWSDSDKMLQNRSGYILQCRWMMTQGWLQKKRPTSLSKQRNGDILQFAKSVTRARFSRAAWV